MPTNSTPIRTTPHQQHAPSPAGSPAPALSAPDPVSIDAPTPAPPVVPVVAAVEPEYDDQDMVTVISRPMFLAVLENREPKHSRFWLDGNAPPFIGGVAHNVSYAIAKGWRKKLPKVVRIIPNDTDEIEYPRLVGVQAVSPTKLAAFLRSSDVDAVLEALPDDVLLDWARRFAAKAREHATAAAANGSAS